MPNHEYTRVESPRDFEGASNLFSCNDCGAYGEDPREIKHHNNCMPGESEKWKKFYNDQYEKCPNCLQNSFEKDEQVCHKCDYDANQDPNNFDQYYSTEDETWVDAD